MRTGFVERITADVACRHCRSEVKVTVGAAVYARVIHAGDCPWLPRYLAREPYPLGNAGAIPCGVSKVTHRGPYKRPRRDAA